MSAIIEAVRTCFKTCPMCKTEWDSMDDFLADPHLIFNGYQPNFGDLYQGIFYFTHETDYCGSTMALAVQPFASLYSGPKFTKSKQLSAQCPRHCLDKTNLKRCNAHCENAFAREIAAIIKEKMSCHSSVRIQEPRLKNVPGILELH